MKQILTYELICKEVWPLTADMGSLLQPPSIDWITKGDTQMNCWTGRNPASTLLVQEVWHEYHGAMNEDDHSQDPLKMQESMRR